RTERIPFSTCFATVVIDRVLDGLTASAILVGVIVLYPLPLEWKISGYIAAAIYLATLVGLIGLIWKRELTLRLMSSVLRVLPKHLGDRVLGWLGAFVSGLGVFRNPGMLLVSIALSVVIWVGYGLTLYLMFL